MLGFVICLGLASVTSSPVGEPLPPGARARLGSLEYRTATNGWNPGGVLSPDGQLAVFPGHGGDFRLIRLSTGSVQRELKGTPHASMLQGFTKAGRRIVAWGAGVRMWDALTGAVVGEIPSQDPINNQHLQTISVSADGQRIAFVSGQGPLEVHVWDTAEAKKVFSPSIIHKQDIQVVLSPDGKRLATCGRGSVRLDKPEEKTEPILQLWDVATGQEIVRLTVSSPPGDRGGIPARRIVFSPDGRFLVTGGNPFEVWEIATGKRVRTLLSRNAYWGISRFSPDGKTLFDVSGAYTGPGFIQSWDFETGQRTNIWDLPGRSINELIFETDGSLVALGYFVGNDQTVRRWRVSDGTLLNPTVGHTTGVKSLVFASGGRTIVSYGGDGQAIRWDAASGKEISRAPVRTRFGMGAGSVLPLTSGSPVDAVNNPTIFPDGKRIAEFGFSNEVSVYSTETGKEDFAAFPRERLGLQGCPGAVSADGGRMASFAQLAEPIVQGYGGGPYGGAPVVQGMVQKKPKLALVVWGTDTGEVLLQNETERAVALAFTPSGKRIITATYPWDPNNEKRQTIITAWDVKSGKKISELEGPNWTGPTSLIAANEDQVVIYSPKRLWGVDFANKLVVDEIELLPERVAISPYSQPSAGVMALSPDRKRLAVVVPTAEPEVEEIRIYDWPRAKLIHTFTGHRGIINALAFSLDGKTLASGSADTTILLWDMTTIPEACSASLQNFTHTTDTTR